MTLHAAKGLEFPAVFLPGWEDGLFPSQRSMDESGLKGLEEERRLAYVGITRARRLCTISFAANRRVYNQWQSQLPSRFIDELPPAHIEVLTPPGLYGGGFGAAAPASPAVRRSPTTAAKADVYNSPGWKRMQARAGARGMSQPQEARNMVIDTTAAAGLRPRRARLPPEVRLRHRHRRRGRQAHHRLREGRRQERHRPLRHRRRRRAVLRRCAEEYDEAAAELAKRYLEEGRETFRFDTFGSEDFWGGKLKLHEAIAGETLGGVGPGVSPEKALELGLKVDINAIPAEVADALGKRRGRSRRPGEHAGPAQGQRRRRRDRLLRRRRRDPDLDRHPVRPVPLDGRRRLRPGHRSPPRRLAQPRPRCRRDRRVRPRSDRLRRHAAGRRSRR